MAAAYGGSLNIAICPLCESRDSEKRFVENGYDVRRCRTCGLFFIDPYPQLHKYRQSVTANKDTGDAQAEHLEARHTAEVVFYEENFGRIAVHCQDAQSVLDIGCGTGRLLELLRAKGINCEGVELNKDRAAIARLKSGCTVHVVPVEELNAKKTYDVITMINVLSHIHSIPQLFEAIDRLLKKNGKLILMSGEIHEDVKRGDLLGWAIPIHLHFLGLPTIDYICNRFGYQILERKRTPYSDYLFSRTRFETPGRSRWRDLLKRIMAQMPWMLRFIRWTYQNIHKERVMTSLIVLAKQAS